MAQGKGTKENRRFADWLAKARVAAGLTQAQLSEYLNVSQATISYWESQGREAMEPAEIRDLARLLRVEAVEVAAALGYPVMPRERRPIPLSPIEAMDAAAELAERLRREVEEWASEHFPADDAAQPPARRNG